LFLLLYNGDEQKIYDKSVTLLYAVIRYLFCRLN